MKKKIEEQIQKADTFAKSILKDESDTSELTERERIVLKSMEKGSYESNREKAIEKLNQQENWKRVEFEIKKRKKLPIYRTLQFWQPAAAVVLLFVLIGGAFRVFNDLRTTEPELVQPGTSIAYLEVDGIQKIALSKRDTVLVFDRVNAKIDSGKITYTQEEIKTSKNEFHRINVPRNGEYYVVLSDGTKVWVNSESAIGFNSHFSPDRRIVELEGEAYFEVAKDSLRPFIVKTNNMDVRVLGTQFNVKAYPDEEYTYTTLNEGSVKLTMGNQCTEMAPNQQVVLSNSSGTFQQKNVDASIYSAWIDGKFIFKDEPLENIMLALGRWYDVKIFFQNQNIMQERFSMSVDRYDNIEVLLRKMEKTEALRFSLKKKALVVE